MEVTPLMMQKIHPYLIPKCACDNSSQHQSFIIFLRFYIPWRKNMASHFFIRASLFIRIRSHFKINLRTFDQVILYRIHIALFKAISPTDCYMNAIRIIFKTQKTGFARFIPIRF